jgi:hypothetical protein
MLISRGRLFRRHPDVFRAREVITLKSLFPAIDHFARDRGVQVLALPTGQGLIFKSRET